MVNVLNRCTTSPNVNPVGATPRGCPLQGRRMMCADTGIWADTGVRADTGVSPYRIHGLWASWCIQTIQGSLSLISAVSGDSAGFENPGWFGSRPHFAGLF